MQTVLLHIEELENENMKKSLYFGVKNTKNLFYVQSYIHVLFQNVFYPKNESMLTVSYYQHIMNVWRDRNMDLKHNQITPLCHGPGGRMERPPYRGAHQHGQNHPPGLQVCGEPRGLCAACGAVTSNPSERSVFGDEVYTGKGRA